MTDKTYARKLSVLLAILVALSPMATDAYIPAIPTMAELFGVKVSFMETSISSYLLGLGVGLILGGPLSDHFGRRRLIRTGICVFLICCAGIPFLPSADLIIGARFIQAIGGGFVTVVGPAIVRDRFEGKEAARVFALVGLIMGIAPLVAPSMGALILSFLSWQWIFFAIALYALFILLFVMPRLPERVHKPVSPLTIKGVLLDYLHIFRHRQAVGYVIAQSFSTGLMFVFLTGSSFLYISYFQVSESMFPVYFGANMIMAMVFNRMNPIFLNFWSPHRIMGIGLTIQGAAMILFVILALADQLQMNYVFGIMIMGVGSMGLTGSNCMSCFMSFFPEKSGTASGVLGTMQYFIGAGLGALAGILNDGTLVPMSLVMSTGAVISLSAYFFLAGGLYLKLPIRRRESS
ncbi:multidrug effflux MFS transporter [Emcibacter sp.]|uniref:multidrug effflux MFS transporter n=1 Tax=Emcibacter sp. TaxID=1979954 RepID=UPI002AA89502|nr:multidrug effflux MFS transporter [Emcibacter sp.]